MRAWSKFLDVLTRVDALEPPALSAEAGRVERVGGGPPIDAPRRARLPEPKADVAIGERQVRLEQERIIGGFSLSDALSAAWVPIGSLVPPPQPIDYWRKNGFDAQALAKASPTRLMELMADLSPDVSRALWDFLRFSVHGYEIKALQPGSDRPAPKRAQDALDQMVTRVGLQHGSFDIFLSKLFMGAFVRGAFFTERIFDADNRTLLTLAVVDPATARFRRIKDTRLGETFQLGQIAIDGRFLPLDTERVIYLAVDPFPGSPYGRPPITSAVFSVLFLISLLNDIKRVVAQQGYPRIDIEVDLKELAQIIPEEDALDPDAFDAFVNKAVQSVKSAYARLQPESAFVHTSVIKVHSNIGTLDVNSLGMVGNLIERLEQMAMKALKSMPLLMGRTDAMSDANANREWEVYVEGIKNIQHHAENMLGRHFTAALEAQGIAAQAQVRFAELRTAELLRDEMTRQLTVANSLTEYLIGAVDFKTMVFNITGKEPPKGITEPVMIPKNFMSFGASNSAKNVNATENPATATPDQAGGASDQGATGDGAADGSSDNAGGTGGDNGGGSNATADLVTREVEAFMRRQLLSSSGLAIPQKVK